VSTGYVCHPASSGRWKSPLPVCRGLHRHLPHIQLTYSSRSHPLRAPLNHLASQKPIPIGPSQRLSSRHCIGNAPAISLILSPATCRRRTPDTIVMTIVHLSGSRDRKRAKIKGRGRRFSATCRTIPFHHPNIGVKLAEVGDDLVFGHPASQNGARVTKSLLYRNGKASVVHITG